MGEANKPKQSASETSADTPASDQNPWDILQDDLSEEEWKQIQAEMPEMKREQAKFETKMADMEREQAEFEAEMAEMKREQAELEAENAEYERLLHLQQESEQFLPTFTKDFQEFLEEGQHSDIYDPDTKNFLITGQNLSKLVELTSDEDIAYDFHRTMEQVIDKIIEQERSDSSSENYETSDELVDQILVTTLKNAAQNFQDHKISREQFDLSCQAINNLGLAVPLKFNYQTASEFEGDTHQNYLKRQQLQELGIIDDAFLRGLHQVGLNQIFDQSHSPVPEYLQNPSDDMLAYWDNLSSQIGSDALMLFSEIICQESLSRRLDQDQATPLTPAIYFDEQGQLTPTTFSSQSPLVSQLFSSNFNHSSRQSEQIALISAFSDQLEPADKFFFDALSQTNDNTHLRGKLLNFRNNITKLPINASEDPPTFQIIDNTFIPTDAFWSKANWTPFGDLGLIRLFPGYKEHYSPERVTLANLPDQQRQAFQFFLDNQMYKIDQDVNTGISQLIDQTITADGQLADWIFNDPDTLGNYRSENLLNAFPDQLAEHFDQTTINYLQLPEEYRRMLQSYAFAHSSQADFSYDKLIRQCINDDGPTDDFFNITFAEGRYDLLTDSPLKNIDELHFSENQKYILQQYSDIINSGTGQSRETGKEYAHAISLVDIDDLTFEQIDSITEITNRVATSNAIELRRAGKAFLHNIITSDDAFANLDQIEQVFLHNNLPYAGKVFRSFQILYPAEQTFDLDFYNATSRGVLKDLPNTGIISRESVLFADLLKASIGSNNRSMKTYVRNLRQGEQLSEQLINHATTYDQLSKEDQDTLSTYLDHVATLYDQTQAGKDQTFIRTNDPMQDLANLQANFNVTERHSLPDRIVRSFSYMLGIRNLEELESYMQSAITAADAKNRERYDRSDFTLEKNDLVKAIELQYLGDILQNGSICKEFLNGEATSDATPLDTDLTRLGSECTGNIDQAIDWKNRHAAFAAMSVNLVIKDSPMIQENGTKYDPSKLELYDNGNSDCGIRTGFPSSAIDFIVFDGQAQGDQFSDTHQNFNFICAEIAKNGFYIPVVDKNSGECIFTPEQYDAMRQKLSGLEHYDAPEFHFASDEDLYTAGISSIANTVEAQDQAISIQHQAIERNLSAVLTRNIKGFQGLKTAPDGDLTPGFVELIDTGSTNRGTSIPGSKIDFDFIMRIDASTYNNSNRRRIFEDTLRQNLRFAHDTSNHNGLRLKGVEITDLAEPVDLDISFVQRTNHMEFSTEQAVHDRLATIKQQDPERYQAVVANIILAKQVLKNADAYKPKHSSDTFDADKKGGLGGIGIENWILQHGGSFKVAAEDFLAAASQSDYDFAKFTKIYPIWDAGQNHFTVRNNEEMSEKQDHFPHNITYDNFVTGNMDAGGFSRMVQALQTYLSTIT